MLIRANRTEYQQISNAEEFFFLSDLKNQMFK